MVEVGINFRDKYDILTDIFPEGSTHAVCYQYFEKFNLAVGHFRIIFGLFFKASAGAHPFI